MCDSYDREVDRFVSYDLTDDTYRAPGGVRVSGAVVLALYQGGMRIAGFSEQMQGKAIAARLARIHLSKRP